MRRFPVSLPLALLAAALAACSLSVGELNPSPNVLLVKSPHTFGLRFGPEVPESFSLHRDDSGPSIAVSRWHETLSHAFQNGPASFFAPAPGAGPSELTLVIVHTEPTMVSTPLGGSEIALRYQAELLDAHGQPVKTWADTVHHPVVVRSIYKLTDSITESVTSTVATMFEEIAKGLPQPG